MHTKVNNYSSAKNVFNCRNANKSYLLQKCKQKLSFAIVQTKVIFCNSASKSYLLQQCKQKLSLTGCAHKSYRSFDAILRFFTHSPEFMMSQNSWGVGGTNSQILWGFAFKASLIQITIMSNVIWL